MRVNQLHSMTEPQVQSLVRELRSCKLCGAAAKKKKKEDEDRSVQLILMMPDV